MKEQKDRQPTPQDLTGIAKAMLDVLEKMRNIKFPTSLPTSNLSQKEADEIAALHRAISDPAGAADYYDALTESISAFITMKLENIEAQRQSKDLLRLQRYFYLLQKSLN